MATSTARVTPGTHNSSISVQTIRNRLREAERRTSPDITGNNVAYGHKPTIAGLANNALHFTQSHWAHLGPVGLEVANLVQSMRRRCTAVLNAAGGHTRYWLLLLCPFVQGHVIPFLLVTCLWKLFSLCLSCWILCSYKYLHMLGLLKINAVDSERTFLFLLSLYIQLKLEVYIQGWSQLNTVFNKLLTNYSFGKSVRTSTLCKK